MFKKLKKSLALTCLCIGIGASLSAIAGVPGSDPQCNAAWQRWCCMHPGFDGCAELSRQCRWND